METAKLAELKVLTEAKKLEEHTLIVTGNEKRYPKKYRVTLCARMQDEASEIVSCITDANDFNLTKDDEKEKRLERQLEGLRNCKKLISHIELSYKMKFIGADSFSYWSKMANSVRNMLAAWHKSDKARNILTSYQKIKNRSESANEENRSRRQTGGKL